MLKAAVNQVNIHDKSRNEGNRYMKLRSNRFCLLFVLDPIHDCSSAHFQCYSNQLWISKWFLVAPVWLHVFSVYFIHEFLQQSLR